MEKKKIENILDKYEHWLKLYRGEKSFLLFQMRAYRGYSKEDLEGKTLKELKAMPYKKEVWEHEKKMFQMWKN